MAPAAPSAEQTVAFVNTVTRTLARQLGWTYDPPHPSAFAYAQLALSYARLCAAQPAELAVAESIVHDAWRDCYLDWRERLGGDEVLRDTLGDMRREIHYVDLSQLRDDERQKVRIAAQCYSTVA